MPHTVFLLSIFILFPRFHTTFSLANFIDYFSLFRFHTPFFSCQLYGLFPPIQCQTPFRTCRFYCLFSPSSIPQTIFSCQFYRLFPLPFFPIPHTIFLHPVPRVLKLDTNFASKNLPTRNFALNLALNFPFSFFFFTFFL